MALLDIDATVNSNNGNTTNTTSTDDHSKVAALADGFANSAVNSTNIDDGSTGLVGVGNSSNSHNDSSTTTTNTDASQTNGNGDNRDNSYDYDSKTNTTTTNNTSSYNHQDTDTKVTSITDTKDSYNTSTKDSGNSYSDSSTHVKDSGNTYTKDSGNSYSYSDSSTHQTTTSDYDFGTLKDIGSISGNVGIAGGDLNFNLGSDYSFNLNLDNILNNALNGDGNHTGFSLVQANNLADMDTAYNVTMNNQHATNDLSSSGGDSHSDAGIGFDSKSSWDPNTPIAGHDLSGTSHADSSSILANSGYHQELVQGANLVSNTSDIAVTGGDHHDVTTTH